MKNKHRFLILFLIFLFSPFQILAYDNLTTHPALTSEIINFYNNFYSPQINSQEKEWLIEGSKKEDEPVIRTLNHFYDPIYQRGLSGEINAGVFTPLLTVLKPFIKSAQEWSQNSYAQATFLGEAYRNAALNPFAQLTQSSVDILTVHTWEKAIYNYILGNKKETFEDLGHVMHLLEDMAVPAHTRNDHHLTGDDYEKWASQFTPQNINVISQLKNKGDLFFNNLNEAFDFLATYTNTHFYSQDTIGIQSGYNQPEWNYLETKIINGYEYSINSDDLGQYLLLKKERGSSFFVNTLLDISIKDKLIYSDYWSHLSKKTVLVGAGVLNLFFREVEKYKNDADFLAHMKKTILATTIENIKKSLGLVKEKEKEEQNVENIITDNTNIKSENYLENSQSIDLINQPLSNETNQEVILLPTPLPTPSLTPLATIVPSPTVLITPVPTLIITPQPTPTPIYFASSSASMPTPTATPIPASTSTPTPEPTPTPTPISKILISEILYDAEGSDEGKEFIELYNPNDIDINLIGWSLRIIKNNSTTSNSLASINKNDLSVIKSRGYLLIGFNKYDASNYNGIKADIVRTSNSLLNPKEDETIRIILVDNQNNIIDEIIYQEDSCPVGYSLERKANALSTAESMINGDARFLGNGYDSDLMEDFICRLPQPQNSNNLPEPRQKPPKAIDAVFEARENNQIILTFALEYATSSEINFEIKYASSSDLFNEENWSSLSSLSISDISFNSTNNRFETTISDLDKNYFVAIRTYDEDGLYSDISTPINFSHIQISNPDVINIRYSPLVYYSATNQSPQSLFCLSNLYVPREFFIDFTSQESGYLKNLTAIAKSINCPLFVSVKIYEFEDDINGIKIKKELGESQRAVAMTSYWSPGDFTWDFKEGDIILIKGHQYELQFYIKEAPSGNCWTYFPDDRAISEDKIILSLTGYKNRLSELSQKSDGVDLVDGETIFNRAITFSARVFNYNDWPLKLQVELRRKGENFDDQINKGNPHLFESSYVNSGEIVEVAISDLVDDAYRWRARVVDIFGNASDWYYFDNPNNFDFYVDADKSDYPSNTLYFQNLYDTNLNGGVIGTTMYGPSTFLVTFLPHQSGYVDRIEVPVYYFYCSFPLKAQLLSINPNKANGMPDVVLANSIESANSGAFYSFAPLVWKLDREVFLEADHYYALKMEFDNVNTGTANCSVIFAINSDSRSSRAYKPLNDGWEFLTNDDLSFVVYKKEETQTNKEEELQINNEEFIDNQANQENSVADSQ